MEIQRVTPKMLDAISIESAEANERYSLIVARGKETFKNTAYVENKPWAPSDVDAAKHLLLQCAPFAHPNIMPGYWDHLDICMLYGIALGEQALQIGLSPYELAGPLLIHDLGMITDPRRGSRADVITSRLLAAIGVRHEVIQKIAPKSRIIGTKTPIQNFDEMSDTQRIGDLLENLGKLNPDGTLYTLSTMQQAFQKLMSDILERERTGIITTNQSFGVWPSEIRGRYAMQREGRQKFAIDLVLQEITWIQNLGVNLDVLRKHVYTLFQDRKNQAYLLALKNAQETLDHNIDRLLERPPIKAVVFDVGDVLFQGKNGEVLDDELVRRLSMFFDCPREKILSTFSVLHTNGMIGAISEREYLTQFWQLAGKNGPNDYTALKAPFIHPDIYQPNTEMQEIIHDLSRNPGVELYVFSNVVSVLSSVMIQQLRKYYPEIPAKHIFVSNQLQTAKGVTDETAYSVLIQKVGINPHSIIFIDDNEKYTVAARVRQGIRGFTFRGDSSLNLNPPARLRRELQKAELI